MTFGPKIIPHSGGRVFPGRRGINPGAALTARSAALPAAFSAAIPAVLMACLLLAGTAAAQSEVRIDDFSQTMDINEVPDKWNFNKIPFTEDEGIHFRFVHDDSDGTHFIHLKSGKDNSYMVGKGGFEYEVADLPILEWEWRVVTLPTGGDVRIEEKDDQAASICVVIDPGTFGADETLCYIWENKGPVGAELTSTKREDSKYIILRAADTDQLGKWYKERRNTLEDFKRVFGYEPPDEAIIGVQIDSDSTESSAEVFYRNIILKKR